jgi:hypothetical protein
MVWVPLNGRTAETTKDITTFGESFVCAYADTGAALWLRVDIVNSSAVLIGSMFRQWLNIINHHPPI